MADSPPVLVILGNQLFPPEHLREMRDSPVFMAEDMSLCTYVAHHQQKIVLFLAAMRAYRDELRSAGFDVRYCGLDPDGEASYEDRLGDFVDECDAPGIVHFEIEDRAMEVRLVAFAAERGIDRIELRSPMFLCGRDRFADYVASSDRLLMADFYRSERKRIGILVDEEGKPAGGQWSFDADNRKKLPRDVTPPSIAPADRDERVQRVVDLVAEEFGEHPGTAEDFWWPTTRAGARAWLEEFVSQRLDDFGPYEDAISTRSDTVFHSLLSPLLNIGLLTPREAVDAVLDRYCSKKGAPPIQSVEGFVRQVIGWREFIRGIYRHYGERQAAENFWQHERELTGDWYAGTTGIPPLDDAINTAQKLGWLHHISRLMVVANLMTLCEIRPATAHEWFMEMFVDSSEWVMGPNVYGMGIFSDGGLFATKPYICGSNYLRKMSDYGKGDWCDTVDGLYWRFIDKHRDFFEANPRLALMPKAFDRLKAERKRKILPAAESFLERYTR